MNKILLFLLLLPMVFLFESSCSKKSDQESSYWENIKKKFEEAASDNKELSGKAKEWIEEDIKKIGDWEYKAINITYEHKEELEIRLNELGNERWECFWIETGKKDSLFIFKRPKVSYLQRIPKGELFKMLNSSQEE